jgi:hydroxymethylglutaryl-CoA lyase
VAEVLRRVDIHAAGIEIGVHLNSRPEGAAEKILAAYDAGCRRIDSALTGLGGCPFAGDHLVGNIPTELVIGALSARGVVASIQPESLEHALQSTYELRRAYSE